MMHRDPAHRPDAPFSLAQFESIVSTLGPRALEAPVILYKNIPVVRHGSSLFVRMRKKMQKRTVCPVRLIFLIIESSQLTALLVSGTKGQN